MLESKIFIETFLTTSYLNAAVYYAWEALQIHEKKNVYAS